MKKIIFYSSILAMLGLTAGCQNNQQNEGNGNNSGSVTSQTSEKKADTQTTVSNDTQKETAVSETSSSRKASTSLPEGVSVSASEAINTFKQAHQDAEITKLELDKKLSGYIYKIEGVDDQKEYEATVNVQTGELRQTGSEMLDNDEQNGMKKNEEGIDTNGLITVEQAGEIAAQEAGVGKAVEWELDRDLGITYWEVKVQEGQREFQVKINAKTGDVLSSEQDD